MMLETGNLGRVSHVDGDSIVGKCPSAKKSCIWMADSGGLLDGSRVSSLQMSSRAVIDTCGGRTNLLETMRMYVSLRVFVSKGGRPQSKAYLSIRYQITVNKSYDKNADHTAGMRGSRWYNVLEISLS